MPQVGHQLPVTVVSFPAIASAKNSEEKRAVNERELQADEDSSMSLVRALMPMLLVGVDPRLHVLRQQWQTAEVGIRSTTNWGFFAHFGVSPSAQHMSGPDFCGGDAVINVHGLSLHAGCILYVEGGALSVLEVYTFDEPWEPPPRFLSISSVTPVIPGERARA